MELDANSKEAFIQRLEQIFRGTDTESQHIHADEALCDLLILLGYGDIVRYYIKIPKWYS